MVSTRADRNDDNELLYDDRGTTNTNTTALLLYLWLLPLTLFFPRCEPREIARLRLDRRL